MGRINSCAQRSSAQLKCPFIHSFIPGTFIFSLLCVSRPKDEGINKRTVISRVCVHTLTHMHMLRRTMQDEEGCARVVHSASGDLHMILTWKGKRGATSRKDVSC